MIIDSCNMTLNILQGGILYKKMFKKIFLLSFSVVFFQLSCFADLYGTAFYSYYPNKYSISDTSFLIKQANDNLRLYELAEEPDKKAKYLKQALRDFYICSKVDASNIDAHIGLGKIYDEMGIDKYAKMEFNFAYNIDNKNPKLNYRYGDFYYKRRQLSLAQLYFERAYSLGYSKNIDLNVKMSKAYIKLAQPQKAEEHLKIANELTKDKVKLAVNSAIKQASGVSVKPIDTSYMDNSNKNLKVSESNKVNQIKKIDITSQVQVTELNNINDIKEVTNNSTVKTSLENISSDKMNLESSKKSRDKKISLNKVKNRLLNNKKSIKSETKQVKFDDIVKKANAIKMIDDADRFKPMYYLFIK